MRYALVKDGIVVNLVEWNGNLDTWQPPEDTLPVEISGEVNVGIGYTYDGEVFNEPEE